MRNRRDGAKRRIPPGRRWPQEADSVQSWRGSHAWFWLGISSGGIEDFDQATGSKISLALTERTSAYRFQRGERSCLSSRGGLRFPRMPNRAGERSTASAKTVCQALNTI